MKKVNIFSIDFRTYQLLIIKRWKQRRFVWNNGHLQFLKYSYLTSIYARISKKKKVKKIVRNFYQDFFFPQTSLAIFDKKLPKQMKIF